MRKSTNTSWSRASAACALLSAMLLTGVISAAPLRVHAAPSIAPVSLGTAGSYSVLSGTSVVNAFTAAGAPHTIIRGNVGVSSLGKISGFPPGEVTGVMHYSDSHAATAQNALGTAFADAGSRTPTATLSADVTGQTLTAGVYNSPVGVSNSGVLSLDGEGNSNAVFILQVAGSLSLAANTEVRLINGAQASRVFWQVSGAVMIGGDSRVIGTIMSQYSISLGAGAVVDGRVLARSGGITLNNNFVDITPPLSTTRFTGILPMRLADTRSLPGWYSPVTVGKVLRVRVTNTPGVPVNATAAALNITAVEPSAAGYLTVYPCTLTRPTTSTVNFTVGHDVANSTIATLASDGYVCVYTSVAVHVVVDITGWFSASGQTRMTPATPHRVADTRSGLGGSGRLSAGEVLVVQTGEPDALAVALNVTASRADFAGFLTVYPCGTTPNVSTVNFVAGEDRPNNALIATDTGGVVCVFASTAVDVIVDVTSVFLMDGRLDYVPAAPVRLLDTRPDNMTVAGGQVQFGVPWPGLTTQAVSVNVAAVGQWEDGYTTAFTCGAAPPNASTVNQRVGEVNANGAIVAVGGDMAGCLYTSTATNLIVDLNGWWIVTG